MLRNTNVYANAHSKRCVDYTMGHLQEFRAKEVSIAMFHGYHNLQVIRSYHLKGRIVYI